MVLSVWKLVHHTCLSLISLNLMQVTHSLNNYLLNTCLHFLLCFKIVWMGKIYDCAHYKKKYGVDHVHFVEEVSKHIIFSLLIVLT